MPPVQQIGPATQNEFTAALYYAPPPQDPPNFFASFWSNFLATRNPWATELFRARLKAMDPSAKANALLALEEEATKRHQAQLNALNVREQTRRGLFEAVLQAATTVRGQDNEASMKNAQISADLRKSQTALTSDQQKALFAETAPMVEAMRQAADAGDPDAFDAAVNAVNGKLLELGGTLTDVERSSFDRNFREHVRRSLDEDAPRALQRLNISSEDAPVTGVSRAGAAPLTGLVQSIASSFGIEPEAGGTAGFGVSGTVPAGLGGAFGAPQVGGVPAAPEFGVTREDIDRIFANRGGLGEHRDPLPGHTRERPGIRRKREAIEGADPAAQVSLATGASAAAEDPLAAFLGGVPRETRAAAQQFAGAEAENRRVGGSRADTLRPTLADEGIAAGIDVAVPEPARRAPRQETRFEEAARKQFDDFLSLEQPTLRQRARDEAFGRTFEEVPAGQRSLSDVRERQAEELELLREADQIQLGAPAEDLDDFLLKKRRKNGEQVANATQ